MTLWSALVPFNFGQWLCPHAHAPIPPPCVRKRKSKLAKSYKPAPLVTPFQKYKKQELALLLVIFVLFIHASGGTHSPPIDPQTDLVPEIIRLQLEFGKLRLRPHSRGGRPLRNVFNHPHVRRRLERQRWHDEASLALLPTQAPPIFYTNPLALAPSPFPAPPSPPFARQYAVQKWHRLKKEADAVKEDREIYAQIRSGKQEATPAIGWRTPAIGWR
ncbi:hypothetical protein B0H12DRAFT_1227708 [Mycena haematopus]|nr:hypothetical protein B0H12DRAFT_1227708 [Mycena haematopus]